MIKNIDWKMTKELAEEIGRLMFQAADKGDSPIVALMGCSAAYAAYLATIQAMVAEEDVTVPASLTRALGSVIELMDELKQLFPVPKEVAEEARMTSELLNKYKDDGKVN